MGFIFGNFDPPAEKVYENNEVMNIFNLFLINAQKMINIFIMASDLMSSSFLKVSLYLFVTTKNNVPLSGATLVLGGSIGSYKFKHFVRLYLTPE